MNRIGESKVIVVSKDGAHKRRSHRLLLRNAVECAAFLDELETIDAGDLTAGEKLTNHAERAVVVFVLPKCRHQHAAIHDEKLI